MCGIAGILNLNKGRAIDRDDLRKMITQLGHRGPDGFGYYKDDSIGLAHARLSIIDLNTGDQPIHNETKKIWVIFNGEIFNYIELRRDLELQGHSFYTKTDTEVIVHLYEQYGLDFVNHLNGQFSIALWDKENRQFILTRDRIGIHPAFYTVQNKQFIFASEIKSILTVLDTSPSLDPDALDQLMTFWAPVSPKTMFQGIYEVSPGKMVVIKDEHISISQYWDWQFPILREDYLTNSEEAQAEELRHLLIDATKIRLRSDVPVGAYLSGGLDSTTITSIIDRFCDVDLRTFSIQFSDKGLDESEYQQQVVQHLNTNHSIINCGEYDIAPRFQKAVWHSEIPMLRTAPVPMMILSSLVRDSNYKVVLTGEGSDEVLGGYDIFKEAKIRHFWAKNPKSEFRPLLLKKLYPYLDLSKTNSRAYLEAFFGQGLDHPEKPYFSHIPRWITTAKSKEFYSADFRQSLQDNAIASFQESLPSILSSWHPFNRAQYIEAKSLMAGYLLCTQGDRMLMANSVEGRFPFLDHRVIEFANRVHPKAKMKVLDEKHLLKMAMDRLIPQGILKRYKQPYRAPDIPAFFNNKPVEYVDELLSSAVIREFGYFDTNKMERLLIKIKKGRAIGYKDNMAFIGVLSTQVWHNLFIKNDSLRREKIQPQINEANK